MNENPEIIRREELTGIILAGGDSGRMGRDKATVSLNGRKLIEYPIDLLSKIAKEVFIVVKRINGPPLNPVVRLLGAGGKKPGTDGKPVVLSRGTSSVIIYEDIIPGFGPLSGIYTGLVHSRTEFNIVLACDMPFVRVEFLDHLLSECRAHRDIIIAEHSNIFEPLCGVYKTSCAGRMRHLMRHDQLHLRRILTHFKTKVIRTEWQEVFFNVNRACDLREARKIIKNED
jgi:molybdopterin-guanine dinucleotide biosynthesis protein A